MTNSFHTDVEIKPFSCGFNDTDAQGHKIDLLGRSDFGQELTALVDRIEEPMVIVLEGDWGSGKSFFLKLWTHSHTVDFEGTSHLFYLDAFRHDYLDDPLVSLVGAITDPVRGTKPRIVDRIRNAAFKLALPVLRIGAAIGTAGASDLAGPIVEAGAKATSQEATDAAEALWDREATRQAAFDDFRAALTELTRNNDDPRNLVIIVDELDRCRPDYALQMLEVAKHFFAVPRVHFVLGCNMAALAASVSHRYGEKLDAERYLQKFVMLRAKLPEPVGSRACIQYINSLFDQGRLTEKTHNDLCGLLGWLQAKGHASLRDVNRILLRLHFLSVDTDTLDWPPKWILLVAVALEVLDRQLYLRFRARQTKPNEIQTYFGVDLPNFRDMKGSPSDLIALVIEGYLRDDLERELRSILKGNWALHAGTSVADEFEHHLRETLDSFSIFGRGQGWGG